MEWDYEIKFKLFGYALLRKKDKFMSPGDKRFRIGKQAEYEPGKKYWKVL
jgi:hypothetical protein